MRICATKHFKINKLVVIKLYNKSTYFFNIYITFDIKMCYW